MNKVIISTCDIILQICTNVYYLKFGYYYAADTRSV